MTTSINGHDVFGAIEGKWKALGAERGPLGLPLSNEAPTFDGRGRNQAFQGGAVSWHPDIGAFAVQGSICARWRELGSEQYGYPFTDESPCPDGKGRFNHFRAMQLAGHPECSIYWSPTTPAQPVYGAIRDHWSKIGWERSALGYPVGPEASTFDDKGRNQPFQGGAISWHPDIGAFSVQGLICAKWREMGAEQYGYPIIDETGCPDGKGRFHHFRKLQVAGHPDQSIYWTPETGAWPVFGGIRQHWAEHGWERGPLGYPVGQEKPTFDNVGSNQAFQGGAMSFHPTIGAFSVQGSICAKWREMGAEQYGYPIIDEGTCPDGKGRYHHFRKMQDAGHPESSIYWTPETGAWPVYGAIRERWAYRGWENSNLGYPVGAEEDWPDRARGRQQRFQNGRVVWTPDDGALFDPMVFSAPIRSGGLAALGGWMSLTIDLAGNVQWKGHAHDSGADGYKFNVSAVLQTPGGVAVAVAHRGAVGGTFTSGSRDHDWADPPMPCPLATVRQLNDAVFNTRVDYTSDILSSVEDLVSTAVKWSVGSALGEIGAIVFLAAEVGSLIGTGSLVPGARIAAGFLWVAGPGNTLFAIAAEGVASLGSRTRELSQAEYDWANEMVYSGSLPDRGKIVLTDTIGGGNNAFTFPRADGKITLNVGTTGFDDPRNYKNESQSHYGYTFIHELVHACQIEHSNSANLVYLGRALAARACDLTGDSYHYGPAGPDYASFGLEAQAQIICDWFAGISTHGPNDQGPPPRNMNSPYFRYVQDMRQGRF